MHTSNWAPSLVAGIRAELPMGEGCKRDAILSQRHDVQHETETDGPGACARRIAHEPRFQLDNYIETVL